MLTWAVQRSYQSPLLSSGRKSGGQKACLFIFVLSIVSCNLY
jgi:hypothetical protein